MTDGDVFAIIVVVVAITQGVVFASSRAGRGPFPLPPPPRPEKVLTVQQRLHATPGLAIRVAMTLPLLVLAVPAGLAAGMAESIALRVVGAIWLTATIGLVLAGIAGWSDRESAVRRRHAGDLERSETFWSQPDAESRYEAAKRAQDDATIAVALRGHPVLRRRVQAERRRPRS